MPVHSVNVIHGASETHASSSAKASALHQKRMLSALGHDLVEARRAAGLTQSGFADRAGCSVLTVRQAETGLGSFSGFVALAAISGREVGARSLPPGADLGARLAALRGSHGPR